MTDFDESSFGTRNERDPRLVSHLTRNTFAMVLAGGRGSRLRELTDWRSKPAVPFGGKFRIIDFTLSNCVNSGVRRVGVATQYKSQSLIRHLQLGWSFLDGRLGEFIEIMPAQQQVDESHWYQGTADAVFQNLREIRHANPEYVLILSGDHIYRMDYGRLLLGHVERKADMTVACIEVPLKEASGFGVMSVHGGYRWREGVQLTAGIDNLFDKTYAESVSRAGAVVSGYEQTTRVNEPGRTLWVKWQFALG